MLTYSYSTIEYRIITPEKTFTINMSFLITDIYFWYLIIPLKFMS